VPTFRHRSCDLADWRIGLSGAVPEREAWNGRPLDLEILAFVGTLTASVLRHGGELVHGCHPSFTPRILEVAKPYAAERGHPVVRMFVSDLFGKSDTRNLVESNRGVASLSVVPAAGEGDFAKRRDPSLTEMRRSLIRDMHAIVVIGGKDHRSSSFTPGTRQELDFAMQQGIPCFVVGGFGGKAAELANVVSAAQLANGLGPEDNEELASCSDLDVAVGLILSALRAKARLGPAVRANLATQDSGEPTLPTWMPRPGRGHLSLRGLRIQLAGAVPTNASEKQRDEIRRFVTRFASEMAKAGGTLVHGSHPSFAEPLRQAIEPHVLARGNRDALTLVRASEYAKGAEYEAQIENARKYARIEVIPSAPGDRIASLVPMREWMVDRCDAVVAIGGDWYDVSHEAAGVPLELEEFLRRGKPGFALGGFGGAMSGYCQEQPGVFDRLRNGLDERTNQALASTDNVGHAVACVLQQLQRLPLSRPSAPGRMFRVLALDGGGLRGAFTAAVLAAWDSLLRSKGGPDLAAHFDLISGTSTGAILAVGLALGHSPEDLLGFYRQKGPMIFKAGGGLRHWLASKHELSTLVDALRDVLGKDTKLRTARQRVVIPTIRAHHGDAEVITTPHAENRKAFAAITAVAAAVVSAAAPTYFDTAVVQSDIAEHAFVDGGLWANNPVLAALAEAMGPLEIPLAKIDVLSVGTLSAELDLTKLFGKGKLNWATEVGEFFFSAQESGSELLARMMLGPTRHLRVNDQVPARIALDDVRVIDEMCRRGEDLGQKTFAEVQSRFLDGVPARTWQE
jgi:uncharacterized protein